MQLVQLAKPVDSPTHYWDADKPLRVTDEHAEYLCSAHGATLLNAEEYDISEKGVVTKRDKPKERAVTKRPAKAETPEDNPNG